MLLIRQLFFLVEIYKNIYFNKKLLFNIPYVIIAYPDHEENNHTILIKKMLYRNVYLLISNVTSHKSGC